MSSKADTIERTRRTIADTMEELRSVIFVPEYRETYKLTFIARHTDNPEMNIVVTEDEKHELSCLVDWM